MLGRRVAAWVLSTVAWVLASSLAAVAVGTEPVVIGAALPLSGPLALSGRNIQRGIELTVELINQRGGIRALGGAPIRVVFADTTSDPATAAAVVNRLITLQRPTALQGAYGSSLTLAATEVSERFGIPFLTMSFSDKIISRGYRHVFQVVATASSQGRAQVRHAVELARAAGERLNALAVVFEDTAYGRDQAEGVRSAARALGLNVVLFEAYPLGLTDAVPLAQKIKSSRADAVFLMSTISDAVAIIRALKQIGANFPVFGGGAGFLEPDFYEAIGADSEGIFTEAPALARGKVAELYRQRFGKFMSHAAFEHAVITEIIAAAVEHARSRDPRAVSQALHELRFTSGLARFMPGGGVQFDERGANVMTYSIMAQWQRGELVAVWPPKDSEGAFLWRGRLIKVAR